MPSDSLGEGVWAAEGPQLLPGCAAYLRLVQEEGDELRAFGEHEMAVCSVEGMPGAWERDQRASTAHCRRACREMGLITDRGKAVPPEGCA